MKKTGTYWRTDKCGRCGDSHSGYSGKLDANGVEYVVCGIAHKRMNVIIQDLIYATIWKEDTK